MFYLYRVLIRWFQKIYDEQSIVIFTDGKEITFSILEIKLKRLGVTEKIFVESN